MFNNSNNNKHSNLGTHALIASLVKRHLLLQKLCLGSGSGLEFRVLRWVRVRVKVRVRVVRVRIQLCLLQRSQATLVLLLLLVLGKGKDKG